MRPRSGAGTAPRTRVVVIGGGFGGLFAARALRRSADVTLIDRTPHHLFQPLLYQVATGMLSEGQIAVPLRTVLERHRTVDVVLADVVGVDVDARTVAADRPDGQRISVPYDDLVLAAGVRQSYFGHDEFEPFAPGMKTVSDALTIRQRVLGAFELADSATDPEERRRRLTFAVVGAGPTGVELAGQIRELATRTLRSEFRHIRPEEAHVLLFDGGGAPLASFGPELSTKAAATLDRLGVDVRLGSIVTHVDGTGLSVRDLSGATVHHDAGTVLWAAGVAAPPVADALAAATGAATDRAGRISVGEDLTVPGHPEISVVGDVMDRPGLPGVAEVAMQSGWYAGRRIRRRIEGGRPTPPFRYRDLGSAAYIARGEAVLSVGPVRLAGLLGWLGWLFIHIAFLTGYRNRAGAVLTWAATFARDSRRERIVTSRQIRSLRALYAAPAAVDREAVPRGAAG